MKGVTVGVNGLTRVMGGLITAYDEFTAAAAKLDQVLGTIEELPLGISRDHVQAIIRKTSAGAQHDYDMALLRLMGEVGAFVTLLKMNPNEGA